MLATNQFLCDLFAQIYWQEERLFRTVFVVEVEVHEGLNFQLK
jgi:hypothetical protein